MARITIDYTPAAHQSAGIGRLTRESVRAVLAQPSAHCFKLFCMGEPKAGRQTLPAGTVVAPLSDRWLHRIWFRARLPLPVELFAGAADLYHATDFILPPTRACATVLTVHDLTFERDPDSAVPSLLRFLKRVVPASARAATHVIADSRSTANDLSELYQIAPGKISVIYSGVDTRFSPTASSASEMAALREKYQLGDAPFVLTVGTLQKRKNHLGLVRAFARIAAVHPETRLVVSGGVGWLYEEVSAEVVKLGLQARVRFAGYVDDADLPALYRAARVFAFPSLYEGFGIPPLEAMASGVPVVSSNTSSLPEVVGDAALTVEPRDIDALAAALGRALVDEAWRATAIDRGIARARTFTWERAGRELLAVYDRALQTR